MISFKISSLRDKVGGTTTLAYILTLFIIAVVYCFTFVYEQNMFAENLKRIELHENDEQWMLMESLFDSVHGEANERAQSNADLIIASIQKEYPDKDVLRREIESGDFSHSKLPLIIYGISEKSSMMHLNNRKNEMLVMLKDGYIFDSDQFEYGKGWHTFEEEKVMNARENFDTIVSLLIRREPTIIYTIQDLNDEENYHKETFIISNRSQIRRKIHDEGIESIKNYEFYGYAYITISGDIFGIPDVNPDTTISSNHKMIILQKFNLYDIMTTEYGDYMYKNTMHYEILRQDLRKFYTEKCLVYLVLLIVNAGAMIFMIFHSIHKSIKENELIS